MDFLKEVEKSLDLPLAEKSEVMRELRSHYIELREEFLEFGMSESRAEEEAERRLGNPVDVAQKMQSVHCRLGWKTAFKMALPIICLQFLWLYGRFASLLLTTKYMASIFPSAADASRMLAEHHHAIRLVTLTTGAAALTMAGIFLYLSIRDWQVGRRSVWLPTWMAVGISALVVSLQSVVRFFNVRSQSTMSDTWLILYVLPLLVIGIFSIWLLKGLPRWRNFAVGVAGSGILVLQIGQLLDLGSMRYIHLVMAMLLFTPALIVLAGIGGFGRHPYGNSAQASLFIWIASMSSYSVGEPSAIYGRVPWLEIVLYATFATAIIATVFAYARQSSWIRKTYVIAAGMMLVRLVSALSLGFHNVPHLATQQAIMLVWQLFFVVVVPLLYGMRQSRQRLEAA